jgi:hypothetical protein
LRQQLNRESSEHRNMSTQPVKKYPLLKADRNNRGGHQYVYENADTSSDDQDLINQLTREITRLDAVISGLRKELAFQKALNSDLKKELAASSTHSSETETSSVPLKTADTGHDIWMRLGILKEEIKDYNAQQQDFLEGLETESMTEQEQAVHESLLEITNHIETLDAAIEEEASAQERRKLRKERRNEKRRLKHLLLEERRIALKQYARSLALKDDEIREFSDNIDYIIRMTDQPQFSLKLTQIN